MDEYTATYSPEDNKLRLYAQSRLDNDEYQQLKKAGFRWAAKQELFVAPMWTPQREDLLIELCGEIGDEDTSLVDRAEFRAERFDGYSGKREQEAEAARDYVKSITDYIPFGQPILVGHHSEKRARKDAERIENGMRRAVKLWDTSKYWKMRAAGALRHAKYKERPDVRARRIKKIEADKRKIERTMKEAHDFLNIWLHPSILDRNRALYIANYSHAYFCFSLDEYPREPTASQYEGEMSLWSALDERIISPRQARNLHVPILERTITTCNRWAAHYDNRLTYEKAMLEEQGAADLLKKKPRPKQLPICNYRAPEGIKTENIYYKGEFINYRQVEMSKDEYKRIYQDYKGTRVVENSHRVRIAMIQNHETVAVFLTDSKTHKKPEPKASKQKNQDTLRLGNANINTFRKPERTEFDDMKDTLKNGVVAATVPQLFPTPKNIAEQVVTAAGIEPGMSVLEPSAGTGALIRALRSVYGGRYVLTAVEIDSNLCDRLRNIQQVDDTRQADFLNCNDELGKYDRIVMNPPFRNGDDIKHIQHALNFLKPSGRLVALCANGPRQQEKLKQLAIESGGYWLELPKGSFEVSGTKIDVSMVLIEN